MNPSKIPSLDKEHSNDPSMDSKDLTIIHQLKNRSITYRVTNDKNFSLGLEKNPSLYLDGKGRRRMSHSVREKKMDLMDMMFGRQLSIIGELRVVHSLYGFNP